MTKIEKILGLGVLIAIVIAISGLGSSKNSPSFSDIQKLGGITNYDSLTLTPTVSSEGLKVGTSSPNTINNFLVGSCALISDVSVAASTTVPVDCAVTGVVPGDIVVAQLATTTASGLNQVWSISGAKASTTAGFITTLLRNNGAAAVPSVIGVGSTTSYIIIRSR